MELITYPNNPDYLVDRAGNVYSLKCRQFPVPHKLTGKLNHDGYLRIQIWKDNKCRFVSVHRIIAETFIPNPNNKPFVNHINGDKSDNRVENLEWVTQKENIAHAWKNGLSNSENHSSVFNIGQYSKDGVLINRFTTMGEAAQATNINYHTIYAMVTRQTKFSRKYNCTFRLLPTQEHDAD